MKTRIALLQINSVPGDKRANLDKIESMIANSVDEETGLYLFCETGTTGYTVDARKVAETIPGMTTDRLTDIAKRYGVYIAGGMIEKGPAKPFNSCVVVSPRGVVGSYRKVHLFADENESFAPGDAPLIIDTPVGRVGVTICFDLMFPEYIRGLVLEGAQIILNSTFWFSVPATEPWGWSHNQTTALAMTRALENNVFVAMACRTGDEGAFHGFGHSCIVGPSGKLLAAAGTEECVVKADLRLEDITDFSRMVRYLESRRPQVYRDMLGY